VGPCQLKVVPADFGVSPGAFLVNPREIEIDAARFGVDLARLEIPPVTSPAAPDKNQADSSGARPFLPSGELFLQFTKCQPPNR
jgi:hypothetical protein